MRVSIVDCYTDEPAGLGVPPYLGTAPRYVFGAIVLAGHQPLYLNIDDVRAIWGEPHEPINETRDPKEALKGLRASSLLVVIGGVHTPGRYLRGTPGTPREIRRLVQEAKMPVVVGGPIVQGTMGGGRALRSDRESLGDPDHIAMGDPEAYVQRYLEVGPPPEEPVYRNYDELDRMALAGATILDQIRRGPDLICELETSRGCSRALSGGCSFCSECSRFGLPAFREASGIVAEAARLREKGVENVRLGRQACFFSYKAQRVGDLDIPIPEPAAIESLLAGCASIGFNCIHIDNVNPGVVAAYPVESEEIAKSIVTHLSLIHI